MRNCTECIWMKVEVNSTLNITNINPQCPFPEIAEFKTTLTPGRPIEFRLLLSELYPRYNPSEGPPNSYPALMFYAEGVFTTHSGSEAYVITFLEVTSFRTETFATVIWDVICTQSQRIHFQNGRIMFPRVRMQGSSKGYNPLSNFMKPIENIDDQWTIGYML